MDRRGALLALGGLLALPRRALAQAPASGAAQETARKSSVFLDYDQAGLDRAYDQRVWAPNAAEVIKRYATDSAAVRERLPFRTVRYGPSPDETMDLFGTGGGAGSGRRPIHAHLHGGAWRALTKEDAAFLAPPVVEAGGIFAALNFAVIPQVRLPEMVEQCRRAVAWLHGHAGEIGGDPGGIHLSGHSSGAHMAAVLMTSDWAAHGLPPDVIRSGFLVSGMYDLAPVLLSSRSGYVTLSEREVADLSPVRHLDRLAGTALLAYGLNESPEFQRQSRDFAAELARRGQRFGLLPLPGRNHFEAPYALTDGASEAARLALALMRPAGP